MDWIPAAFFLIPGAFAVNAHRFASAQAMSIGSQVAWATIYSTLAFLAIQTPVASWLVTPNFPSALFGQDSALVATPGVAIRFLAISVASGLLGLVGGRAAASKRAHRLASLVAGRNLHSTVWIEVMRNAPRQWVRLTGPDLDLIGWLESASDGPTERSLVLSHVYRQLPGGRERIPANLMLVDTTRFDTVVLLGADVAATYARATEAPSSGPVIGQ